VRCSPPFFPPFESFANLLSSAELNSLGYGSTRNGTHRIDEELPTCALHFRFLLFRDAHPRDLQNRPYDRWLRRFLEHVSQTSKNQDKELLQFMMDLPELPIAEISRLEDMCLNSEQCALLSQRSDSSMTELRLLAGCNSVSRPCES
jgi:hypothetical protein